ncbi:TetR family transcriptional regulator [Pseudonocardia eucalypti]|uniref:TetR family transcriptional regulator n=2 Tax=Pseudonocardia eucalypti TaxID=648755 RepID=A0ABP9RBE4_9PSEU
MRESGFVFKNRPMTATFTERVRAQLREELLDAAQAAVFAGGWQRLRMQAIADQVGVSRRTVYNEFGNKARLAEALILRVTERFLDEVQAVLTSAPDLPAGWEQAVLAALRAAESDPLLGTVLAGTEAVEFLPLLTSEGTAVIDYATERMTLAARQRWPELSERSTRLAAEATVRLTLSHIVRPGPSLESAARDIAELTTGYLAPDH